MKLSRLLLTALLAPPAFAQTLIAELTDPPTHISYFGRNMIAPGDLTGDGIDDIVVTLLDREVRAYSGADWSLHTTIPAPAHASNFGIQLAALGDVDGDGLGDYAVAQPTPSDYRGIVWVISGATGTEIRRHEGGPADLLGTDLAAVGDVDGDGVQDLAAHAFNWLTPGVEIEYILIWSGATGDLIRRIDAPGLFYEMGRRIGRVGDVDGDGVEDMAYSWSSLQGNGYMARSGATGAVLFEFQGTTPRQWGEPIPLDDVNGDGRPDHAVVTLTGPSNLNRGLWIVSADGSLIAEFSGLGQLSPFGAARADLDGDGARDFVLCERRADGREVLAHRSGRTGEVIAEYEGSAAAPIDAERAIVLEDVNGDGREDIAAYDASSPGFVRIFSGAALAPLERSCVAAPNSVGAGAHLGAVGSLSVLDGDLRLEARGLPPRAFGLFVRGRTAGSFVFGDGVLCVSPFDGGLVRIEVVQADDAGAALTSAVHGPTLPGTEILLGSSWSFQMLYRDPSGGPAGFSGSDALRGAFVP